MFNIIKTRIQQKYRTFAYPDGPPPELPQRFAGRPLVNEALCNIDECGKCADSCPVQAIHTSSVTSGPIIDTGKCIFCRRCESTCVNGVIQFSMNHRLAASDRNNLFVKAGETANINAKNKIAEKLFKRSLKLRQVSAGGCNACEADTNVLGTLAWDIGRFGIQFVASPRHADGLLITGPVTNNMYEALLKTYRAVPDPKVVIAVGSCAISGGPFSDHPEQHNGAGGIVPIDLFIPGCPPHPLTILDGLLRFTGRID